MAKRRSRKVNHKRNRIKSRGKNYRFRYAVTVTCACLVALLVIVSGTLYYVLSMYPKDVINDNIYIGNVEVGGDSIEQAAKELDSQLEETKKLSVTMKVGEKEETITLEDLGIQYEDKEGLVQQAFDYGKKGDPFSRYRKLHGLSKEPHVIDAVYTLDQTKAETMLEEKVASLASRAENARLETSGDKVEIIDAVEGKTVDVPNSIKKIEELLNKNWDYTNISLEMEQIKEQPEITAKDLEQMTDVLGYYSTYVGTGEKRTNVENGANRLNGTILKPGEEIAVDGAMGPFDAEHGYILGNSYAGSEVEETYGGGVCQVSTTLYNAALYAELDIVERHPHSMLITYVDPSRDAAVATGVLDLVLRNNYDTPIYIAGEIDDQDCLNFTIYGKDTRDEGRSVEFESEILETEDYEVTYEIDSESALGNMEYSGNPCMGMSAQLWKIVYEDGEEVSREVINTSTYQKSDQIIKVGIACDEPAASALVSDAVASQDPDQISSAIAEASAMLY